MSGADAFLLIGFYAYVYSVYAYALTCRYQYVCNSVYLFCLYPQCGFWIGFDLCFRGPDFKRPLLYEIPDIE